MVLYIRSLGPSPHIPGPGDRQPDFNSWRHLPSAATFFIWMRSASSKFAAVVGPMQECLALLWAARFIARQAVRLNLSNVTAHRNPAPDLSVVVRASAAKVVAAVPLKPAARILGADPSPFEPLGSRLTCRHAKVIKRRIGNSVRIQFCMRKPLTWKFLCAFIQVNAAEHTEREHVLGGGKIRLEARIEFFSRGTLERIPVARLQRIA